MGGGSFFQNRVYCTGELLPFLEIVFSGFFHTMIYIDGTQTPPQIRFQKTTPPSPKNTILKKRQKPPKSGGGCRPKSAKNKNNKIGETTKTL